MEAENSFYDKLYRKSLVYNLNDVKKSPYYKIYIKIIKYITDDERILDIGCGTGQFSDVAIIFNKKYTMGIDFSGIAIKIAKERTNRDTFLVGNIKDKNVYPDDNEYDVAVLCEVLEHMLDDKIVIHNIPIGKHIILTVPNYNSASHVRIFKDKNDVIKWYNDDIKVINIDTVVVNKKNIIFILNGIRK